MRPGAAPRWRVDTFSARQTFGVRLHRRGYDLGDIREVLGLATLSATKSLVEGDPVDLGRIVARVF